MNQNYQIDIEAWDDWQDEIEEANEMNKGIKRSKKMKPYKEESGKDTIDRGNARGKLWQIGDE